MTTHTPHAALARRLAAIAYDAMLLGSVLFLMTLPVLAATGGKAIAPGNPLYTAYLLVLSFLYFAWQWTHGGQTLGMKTWRIRICTAQGHPIDWTTALKRFGFALLSWLLLGLGYLLSIVHPRKLALHDILSNSVLLDTRG